MCLSGWDVSQPRGTHLRALFSFTPPLVSEDKKARLQDSILSNTRLKTKLIAEVKARAAETDELRQEIDRLGKQVEDSSNESIRQQEITISQLEIELNRLTTVRDKDRAELTKTRTKNMELAKQLQDIQETEQKVKKELSALEKKIRESKSISKKELRRKVALETQQAELKYMVEERTQEIAVKKELLARARKDLTSVESELNKAEQMVNEAAEEQKQLDETAYAMNELLLQQQDENKRVFKTLAKEKKELEAQKQHVNDTRIQAEDKRKMMIALGHKVSALELDTHQAETEKLNMQERVKELKNQLTAETFKLNGVTKGMDTCAREREVLSQNHSNKVESINQKEALLKIHQSTLVNIQNEHKGYLNSIRLLHESIERLKEDKLEKENELGRSQEAKRRAEQAVAERELRIVQFQQQIQENESKLRQQLNTLESVRSDRHTYRNTLTEQKLEMAEYKRKFNTLNYQIKQLKAEIADKDERFITEHFNLRHVNRDIKALKAQVEASTSRLSELDKCTRDQSQQIRKLTTIIADADEELRVQQKQYHTIADEQRVLNQQLIERNEDLAKLFEKLKLNNSMLGHGAADYKRKQEEMATLLKQREELAQQVDDVYADIGKYEELTGAIAQVERELVEEQLKVKALSEELRKPINIHRWRRLMDTNTDTFSMIKRVRQLQREISDKADKVETKDKNIQNKEKLYVDLRRVLARQPGSEAAEQLRVYAAALREKRSKLKTMKAELKLYQTKVFEYKYSLEKLDQDLKLLKLEWFARRRRDRAETVSSQNMQQGMPGMPMQYDEQEDPRYGGGAMEEFYAAQQAQAQHMEQQEIKEAEENAEDCGPNSPVMQQTMLAQTQVQDPAPLAQEEGGQLDPLPGQEQEMQGAEDEGAGLVKALAEAQLEPQESTQ